MLFLYGFLTCWLLIGLLAWIADVTDSGGIWLDDGWASIMLVLPYYIVLRFLIRPIYRFIKHKKEKKKKEGQKDEEETEFLIQCVDIDDD